MQTDSHMITHFHETSVARVDHGIEENRYIFVLSKHVAVTFWHAKEELQPKLQMPNVLYQIKVKCMSIRIISAKGCFGQPPAFLNIFIHLESNSHSTLPIFKVRMYIRKTDLLKINTQYITDMNVFCLITLNTPTQ